MAPMCRDPTATPALAAIRSVLNVPVSVFGWGLGDNIHASNERLKINKAAKGREAWARLVVELAKPSVAAALKQNIDGGQKSEL